MSAPAQPNSALVGRTQACCAATNLSHMNPKHVFEPHLVIKHINLPPAGEWQPDLAGWVFARMTAGQAYAMHAARNQLLSRLRTRFPLAGAWLRSGEPT